MKSCPSPCRRAREICILRSVSPQQSPEYSDAEVSEDGVDLTLIRWMLSLTPRERLAVLQDQVDSLLTLRAKFESQVPGNTKRPDPAPR
jgi:hypothetical protein